MIQDWYLGYMWTQRSCRLECRRLRLVFLRCGITIEAEAMERALQSMHPWQKGSFCMECAIITAISYAQKPRKTSVIFSILRVWRSVNWIPIVLVPEISKLDSHCSRATRLDTTAEWPTHLCFIASTSLHSMRACTRTHTKHHRLCC